MLFELNIRNFAVIEYLRVTFGPGFNVITGETGAGKSVILEALSLLLGGRADPGVVRAGEERACVEGIFEVPEGAVATLSELLEIDVAVEGLILAREVAAGGRSVCRVNGKAVPLRRLSDAGNLMVDVHGQSEHLSLLRPRTQLDLLDRYAGLTELRKEYAGSFRALSRVRTELAEVQKGESEALHRCDLLRFQVNEITAARLEPGEERSLRAERSVLVNAQRIRELVGGAEAALDGDAGGAPGALEKVYAASKMLSSAAGLDPAMEGSSAAAESAALQLEELVRDLRRYLEGVEFDPQRVSEVEARLDLLASLNRKYGGDGPAVAGYLEEATEELARLENRGTDAARLRADLERVRLEAARIARELAAGRRAAAQSLAAAVEEQLAQLGLDQARLAVRFARTGGEPEGLDLGPEETPAACLIAKEYHEPLDAEVGPYKADRTGVDSVEFVVSTNPGEPLRSLAAVASGGETSRLMLAMKVVLSAADQIPTLVFDEVDAGIGGRVGEAVGKRLRLLGMHHQVIAVTHLPQIAAEGDVHLAVRKVMTGGRTATELSNVVAGDRLDELTQMLGSDTPATRQKAAELLGAAGRR